MVCGAILFGATRHLWPGLYCAATPLAALLYLLVVGFPPRLGTIDHVVIIAFILLWGWYATRIVAIARAYPDMPEAQND